ncbi:hypothetical protein ABW20_dc0102641 [Dactylellina cionopaga]|nr:hypothetical protein ABW20_dc0102641 [Dactylellina cionopaga]
MEGLSVAANVIAVIDLSIKLGDLVAEYIKEVKNAEKDIKEVQANIKTVENYLYYIKTLVEGPNKAKFEASSNLQDALDNFETKLRGLQNKLDEEFITQMAQKKRRNGVLGRMRVRGFQFKWPFVKPEVESIMKQFKGLQRLIDSMLQIDHIKIVLSIEQEANLAKIPVASGATFGSFDDEQEPECLPGTRIELLEVINQWVGSKETNVKPIFWLCGKAGTGKSTISRTVARVLRENSQLAASFFFKRGKANRGDASMLIGTIAADLRLHIPQLGPKMSEVIEKDPHISRRALNEQFQKLILTPLSKIDPTNIPQPMVIVIDALDECDGDDIARRVLGLLERLQAIDLDLRIFITSRPEMPINLGFKEVEDSTRDVHLHDIQKTTIKHDISLFLDYSFTNIQKNRRLPADWPGNGNMQIITEITVPLFISAATVCRFIGDTKFPAQSRLNAVLESHNMAFASKYDKTYIPVINQLLVDTNDTEKKALVMQFREIVGTIVLLESPLSLFSLSQLICKNEADIQCILDLFQSVLSIPEDHQHPIQTYHLSFRDFLLDENSKKQWFWLDAGKVHKKIAMGCIQVLSDSLKQDICNLRFPGVQISDLGAGIEKRIPSIVQYACQYWIIHLKKCIDCISEGDKKQVHKFLQEHLLHWLEAMSILKAGFRTVYLIGELELIVRVSRVFIFCSAYMYSFKQPND